MKVDSSAVRREGLGLPLWTDWGGNDGYLPLILPLASALEFWLSRSNNLPLKGSGLIYP
jgi:hypothetical protein